MIKTVAETLGIPLIYDNISVGYKGEGKVIKKTYTDAELEILIAQKKELKKHELYSKIKEKTVKQELQEDCTTIDQEIENIKTLINL